MPKKYPDEFKRDGECRRGDLTILEAATDFGIAGVSNSLCK